MLSEDLALFNRTKPKLPTKAVLVVEVEHVSALIAAAREEGRQSAGDRVRALEEAAAVVERMIPAPAGGLASHTNSMRVVLLDAAKAIRALLAPAPPAEPSEPNIQADLDILGGLVSHLKDGLPLTVGDPTALASTLERVLSHAYPSDQRGEQTSDPEAWAKSVVARVMKGGAS